MYHVSINGGPGDIPTLWVEFPKVDNLNLKIIKPKDSEAIIRQALQLGWNPEEPGSPIVYDLIDNKLLKRKKHSYCLRMPRYENPFQQDYFEPKRAFKSNDLNLF
jgi:hypothetical protein